MTILLSIRFPVKQFLPLLSSVFIIVTVLLVTSTVIVSRLQDIISRWNDLPSQEEKLKTLKKNAETLTQLTDKDLIFDLSTLERVLPAEKDVFAVIGGIETIARQTNGQIDSFAFTPGFISTPSAAETNDKIDAETNSFSVTIIMPGNQLVPSLKLFYSVAPLFTLSEVTGSYYSNSEANVAYKITTYIQSLPRSFGTATSDLQPLTSEKRQIISELSKWQTPADTILEYPISTSSGRRKNLFSF